MARVARKKTAASDVAPLSPRDGWARRCGIWKWSARAKTIREQPATATRSPATRTRETPLFSGSTSLATPPDRSVGLSTAIPVSTGARAALIAPSGDFPAEVSTSCLGVRGVTPVALWAKGTFTTAQAAPLYLRASSTGGPHPVASRPVAGDIFAKCSNPRKDQYTAAVEAGIVPYFKEFATESGPTVVHDGRSVIMLGSNNYLGLTSDPRVKNAAADAVDRYGSGVTGSRLMNGTLPLHRE